MHVLVFWALQSLFLYACALDRVHVCTDKLNVHARFCVGSQPFFPRGVTFVHSARDGDGLTYSSTFAAGRYDPRVTGRELAVMAQRKYNVVRVIIDPGDGVRNDSIAGPVGGAEALDAGYLGNVVDFVRQAAAAGLWTLPVLCSVPHNAHFQRLWGRTPKWAGPRRGPNASVLTPGGVAAKTAYARIFVSQLKGQLVDTTSLLGLVLEHELALDLGAAPFSWSNATAIGTADGRTHDVTQDATRQPCADSNTVSWLNAVRGMVHAVDPTLLVGVGIGAAEPPTPSRLLVGPRPAIAAPRPARAHVVGQFSRVDFVEVHVTLRGDAAAGSSGSRTASPPSFEWMKAKPVLLGELAAVRPGFSAAAVAATSLVATRAQSCARDVPGPLAGYILWNWDCVTCPGRAWTAREANATIDTAWGAPIRCLSQQARAGEFTATVAAAAAPVVVPDAHGPPTPVWYHE